MNITNKPTFVDLFCGMGGISLGFKSQGFQILWANDNWKTALDTYHYNFKQTQIINNDIQKLSKSFLKNYINKIDIIAAGPPCQGFSMSGLRDKKDKRNDLFHSVVDISKLLKPQFIIMENVVGLLSMTNAENKPVKEIIIEEFKKINYKVEYKILNSADFGVPQNRKRVIFIISQKGNIGFPTPTHLDNSYQNFLNKKTPKKITAGEALNNIPNSTHGKIKKPKNKYQKSMFSSSSLVHNHDMPNHSPEIIQRMSFVPQGGNWKNVPKEYYQVGGIHSNNYRRLHSNKPSITIKHAAKSMIIHPTHDRGLTVREVARIQSFHDSFKLLGTKSEQHQQLANAVPPILAEALARHLKKYIMYKPDKNTS